MTLNEQIDAYGRDGSRDRLVLTILCVIALLLRLYANRYHEVMVPDYDGYHYIKIAQGMLKGRLDDAALNWTPLFPILIALLSFLPASPDVIGSYINIFIGSLTIIPVYMIVRKLYTPVAGLITAAIYAFNYVVIFLNVLVMSETSYIFVALLLGYLALHTADGEITPRHAILFGLLGALVYHGRPEGILLVGSLAIYTIVCAGNAPWRKKLSFAVTALLTFTVLSAPYLMYIFQKTGQFNLSGKVAVNLSNLRYKLGITDNITSLSGIYFHDPGKTMRLLLGNVVDYFSLLKKYTVVLWLFIVVFFLSLKRSKPGAVKTLLFFFCMSLPSLANFLFYVDLRLSHFLMTIALISVGIGISQAFSLFPLPENLRTRKYLFLYIGIVLYALFGLKSYSDQMNSPVEQRNYGYAYRHYRVAGEWLRANCPPGGVVLSTNPNYLVSYYAGMDFNPLPAPLPEEKLYEVMAERQDAYLFVDDIVAKKYFKNLSPLFNPGSTEFRSSGFARKLEPLYADYRTGAFIYRYKRGG